MDEFEHERHAVALEWRCEFSDFATNHSAVTWATGYLAPSPDGAKLATNNQWNWDWARFDYRQALTARTAAEREQAYAQMFRALGQVLHLVQDMGVPAHARNDFMAHLKFAEINGLDPTKWFANPYEYYVKKNDALVALHPAVYPAFTQQPGSLTDFWDTNRYDAGCTTPSARRSGRDLGFAEYTNANFLSDSTIFTEGKPCDDIRFFPHPRLDETDFNPGQWPLRIYNAEDGRADTMRLVSITDTEGLAAWDAPTRAVVAVRYLARYLQEEDPSSFQYYERNYYLNPDDDAVHRDTADRLLPRAVGYSAALLDYFFRGRFDSKDVNTPLVETLSPASIRLNFKNASGEAFVNGTIYLYQDSGEEGEIGKTNLLEVIAVAPSVIFTDGAAFGGQEFKNITVTVPAGKSITDLVFTLLYVGRLGWEENAVVAKRFKAPAWVPPVMPSMVRSHSSRLVVRSYMVPHIRNDRLSQPLAEGRALGCSCHFAHSTYPSQLNDDMTNLELCKVCHGPNAVGNHSPSPTWAPPRILVSPDAVPPELVPAEDVTTFNPKPGDTVSGLVQFLPAVLDATHQSQSPMKYRMEVWDGGGTRILDSVPEGPFDDLVSGWRWATAQWFLRDWDYTERLVWNSAAVSNGTYLFRFYPMSNPEYFQNPIQVGLPAEFFLSVQNSPGI